MKPQSIQVIQSELAILWDDGAESYIPLRQLRTHCPCATCGGERDLFGREYRGPAVVLKPESFEPVQIQSVGGYAVSVQWKDGHATGIYPYPYLRKLASGTA